MAPCFTRQTLTKLLRRGGDEVVEETFEGAGSGMSRIRERVGDGDLGGGVGVRAFGGGICGDGVLTDGAGGGKGAAIGAALGISS